MRLYGRRGTGRYTALKKSLVTEFAKVYKLPDTDAIEQIEKAMSGATDPLVFLAEYIAEVNGVTPGNNPQQMAEFVSLMAPKMISDTVGVLRQWRKITKICSFSAVNDSILMWGHYAQDHKGFCVEYDLEKLEPDHPLRRTLYPVIYSPQLYWKCPANSVPVCMRQTGMEGALNGTRKAAYT